MTSLISLLYLLPKHGSVIICSNASELGTVLLDSWITCDRYNPVGKGYPKLPSNKDFEEYDAEC